MTLTLQIMLSIFTLIAINFFVSLVANQEYEKHFFPKAWLGVYILVSWIAAFLMICYIPFIFIWHLY